MVAPFTESWAVLTSALEGAVVVVDDGAGVAVEAAGGAVVGVGVGEAPGFVSAVVGVDLEEAPGFVPPHAATDNAMRTMTTTQPENLRNCVMCLILLSLLLLKCLRKAMISRFFRVLTRCWQDGPEEPADHHGNASTEPAATVQSIKQIPQLFSGT